MSSQEQVPVTAILAAFVANVESKDLTPTIIERIKEFLLDYLGVTVAASHGWESTPEILKAIHALGAKSGSSTAVLQGRAYLPQYAGLLNATFGHSMDFDDTYAPGSLHPGVCAFAASLTQAELQNASTEQFMLAAAVGYEVICRIGRELGNEAYARGFHNTATAGIFGAVAAISVLKRLPAPVIEHAFGLALSKAAGSMQYLENGSWNKRLHPGFAVHDAFTSVALAEAGVVGAARSIEGKFGLLHAYSPKEPDLKYLTADLGTRWEFLETALKPYAACRMTHGVIEQGSRISSSFKSGVQKLTVSLSPANFLVVGNPTPNKIHPKNVVDAQFSIYFQLAHAWLHGSAHGVEFASRLDDPKIHELADKIDVVTDPEVKAFGSKLKVRFEDGREDEVDIPFPLGEPQHPFSRELVEEKYTALVAPSLGREKAQELKDVVDNLEKHTVVELLSLVSGS
ncbi:2-methylcitrate dehydratase [Fusarium albosuccineum]|uniref:2-methylcitrate dehydratase n=1 Tax=Fusarium albosuccineum TaxID=1237068 RepID=A0A8H4P6E3_9HYPO|nr:2-methylcitrate dehydratase [Fusarium albosuccineum]